MSLTLAVILVIAGVALVIIFAELLVKAVTGTSLHFNMSPFLISVIFLGFDPENLGVGAVGSYEYISGIAAGSIMGAAMVALALALGISAVAARLEFRKISLKILLVPFLAFLLFIILVLDKSLGRVDGILLLAAYVMAVLYLIFLNKRGYTVKAGGEVAETLEEEKIPGKWKSAGLLVLSLAAIIGGSEMLVEGSEVLLSQTGLSDTVYGMTILAFVISIEELARELPAAFKGKPEIALGNVIGSLLAFFLFNAGIIALVRPVQLNSLSMNFYLPLTALSVLLVLLLLALTSKIPRWGGILLILLYLFFVIGGFFFG